MYLNFAAIRCARSIQWLFNSWSGLLESSCQPTMLACSGYGSASASKESPSA